VSTIYLYQLTLLNVVNERRFLAISQQLFVAFVMLGSHYPKRHPWTRATFTARKHGPWTRASFLDIPEHGPSRSAGAIVNDVKIIFY